MSNIKAIWTAFKEARSTPSIARVSTVAQGRQGPSLFSSALLEMLQSSNLSSLGQVSI